MFQGRQTNLDDGKSSNLAGRKRFSGTVMATQLNKASVYLKKLVMYLKIFQNIQCVYFVPRYDSKIKRKSFSIIWIKFDIME